MTNLWRPPTELPDLRRIGIIALDTETRDDRLRADMGSGWPFRSGHLSGLSVAFRAENEVRGSYFPIRHPDTENFAPEQIYQWLRDHVAAKVRFGTQNGLYDWGWLRTEAGIKMPPGERLEEIGAAATMVDENRFKYSLDALCAWRGLPGKDDALLREGIEALGLIENKRKKSYRRIICGSCRRAMSGPTPRPMPSAHFCCSRTSIQSSIARAPAPLIALSAIFCRWCWRCGCVASVLISVPPRTGATHFCASATPRSPSSLKSSAVQLACRKSKAESG
jgi:hypothetical protein